jgi:hypothetical protein
MGRNLNGIVDERAVGACPAKGGIRNVLALPGTDRL